MHGLRGTGLSGCISAGGSKKRRTFNRQASIWQQCIACSILQVSRQSAEAGCKLSRCFACCKRCPQRCTFPANTTPNTLPLKSHSATKRWPAHPADPPYMNSPPGTMRLEARKKRAK